MEKIIIKKRILECVITHENNRKLSSHLKGDLDSRVNRIVKLREDFKDVIPISVQIQDDCLIYIKALEDENYEVCNNFLIVD